MTTGNSTSNRIRNAYIPTPGASFQNSHTQIDWVKVYLGDEWDRGKHLIRKVSDRHYQILPAGLALLSES